MFPGETVASGAPSTCYECKKQLELMVCRSGAGYYLGFWCDQDGPHSRETGYFSSEKEAQEALQEFIDGGDLRGQRT